MILRARAALFDMDGTLVDSTGVVEAVWAGFATEHGLDLAQVLAYAHGRLTSDTTANFIPDPQSASAAAARVDEVELVTFTGIVEIPGASALLAALADSPVAVVTSASRALATARMAAAGVPVPATMVAAGEVPAGKPNPAGYLRAAELLGVPASDCLVFEDAEAGLRAAVASGARVVVVGGHESPTTAGLARVADLGQVSARRTPDGWIEFDLA